MKEITTLQGLLKPLTHVLIEECVSRFTSDYYSKSFNTWNHMVSMMYSHMHEIKSLRDLEISFNSQYELRQLIGVGEISRSTLSDANSRRTADCFLWIAQQLMAVLPRKVRQEINLVVRILDSSPIQLKGRGYNEWTLANRTLRCQGLKLHIEFDNQLEMPTKMKISSANYDDCKMGKTWPIIKDTVYVFDKGYYDFNWWWKLNQEGAFFVTRLKNNAAINVQKTIPLEDEKILEDNLFKFKNRHPRGGKENLYTDNLRRVVVKRDDKETPLVIVTNLIDIPATIIAELYKERWRIELFFKWIKQNLKVKKFLGKNENAVKIQLATAIIFYLLVAIFSLTCDIKLTLHQLLIWIRHNLMIRKEVYSQLAPPLYVFPRHRLRINNQGIYL